MNTTTMTKMHHQIVALTAERDHWKANHDNRVRAAKLLTERTDMPMERIGAYKQYTAALESNQKLRERAESAEAELLAVREDNHSMMLEIHNLRIERDALAAELAKLREQEPVAYLDYWKSDGTGIVRKQRTTGVPFFNSPVPAPAVPAPTPFLPDDDTRRNDEAFAAQQAATAPSVPTDEQIHAAYRNALGQSIRERDMPEIRKFARALLQSSDHSEHVLEKVSPNCRACANRGRVNGLSQESYCDSCIYQGRDWRQDHFVDAVKRRCEACAILPCSCK